MDKSVLQTFALSGLSVLVMVVLISIVFMSNQAREYKRKKLNQKMIESKLAPGLKVSAKGMFGTITEVKDHTVLLEIASGVVVEMYKSAIEEVLS